MYNALITFLNKKYIERRLFLFLIVVVLVVLVAHGWYESMFLAVTAVALSYKGFKAWKERERWM